MNLENRQNRTRNNLQNLVKSLREYGGDPKGFMETLIKYESFNDESPIPYLIDALEHYLVINQGGKDEPISNR